MEKNTHSVLDYLKEHTGLLIAGVPAIITIVAFILNAALYNRTYRYLEYWGFSPNMVSIANADQIYIVVITLVFFVASILIQQFLLETYIIYQQYVRALYYLKQSIKDILHKSRKQKMTLLKCRIQLLGIKMFFRYADKNQIKHLQKEIRQLDSDISACIKREKESQKKRRLISARCFKELLPSLTAAFIFIFIFVSILNAFGTGYGKYTIIVNLIIAFIMILLPYCFLYAKEFIPLRKKVKNLIKNNQEMTDELLLQEPSEVEQYPIWKVFSMSAESLFSNKNILLSIIIITMSLVYVFFLFSYAVGNDTYKRHEFSVTTIEDEAYVIIYTNENTYYLDAVTAEENTLIVDTTKQRIIVSDDIVYQVVEFDNVTKISP